jgi:hypothetical protein
MQLDRGIITPPGRVLLEIKLTSQTLDQPALDVKRKESNPVQPTLTAFYVKANGRREQLKFLPVCAGCGEVIFNVAEANVAVIDNDGTLGRPRREGDATFREVGSASIFCWGCDRERNHVPWQNALGTFRGIDEPQRYPEPVRKVMP